MFKVLKGWLKHNNFPDGVYHGWGKPSNEAMKWYTNITDCIAHIDAGEKTIDGRRSEITLIWNLVNFLNSTTEDLREESHKPTLQTHINLYFMLFRQMSFFTYREILELFSVLIQYKNGKKKYFDGKDIYFDTGESCFKSPSLDVDIALTLGDCGIFFIEKGDDDFINFDFEIGDNLMEFIANNKNNVAHYLYWGFLGISDLY